MAAISSDDPQDKLIVEDIYKIFGPEPDEALRLLEQGLSKDEIFERTRTTVGVQNANFSIRDGEVFVVMGLSGSGKSTLVRLLNRLIEPTRGRILLDGRDITAMNKKELIHMRRENMSMVFQSFALMPHKTVAENAAFGLDVAGMDRQQQRGHALKALATVGLEANADSYPDELSGGMKQRVGLARALATNASILLMDEAFSALDPLIRTEMQDELVRLQQTEAHTIVFISHDLDEAIRIGDRIAIMDGGAIVQIGTPQEIVTNPANEYVRSFFYGVDVSKVFNAGDIAEQTSVALFNRSEISVHDALNQMRDDDRHLAVVVDNDRHYSGMVSVNSLIRAKEGEHDWEMAFLAAVKPRSAETDLEEVLKRVVEEGYPVPVVDESEHYLGVIDKNILLKTFNKAG